MAEAARLQPPPGVPAHPFDALADGYDRDFTHTTLGRCLREQVWTALAECFSPGQRVLELGTGTGEDAVWLARHGIDVTATDASTKMLQAARAKAEHAGLAGRITLHHVDWNGANVTPPGRARFDGAVANFGVVNCIADRRRLAARLGAALAPGARAVLVVMGPICAWEILWRLSHGQIRGAFRRLRAAPVADLPSGTTCPIWYPSPSRLAREFALPFRHLGTSSLGFLLPPTELRGLVERWPRLFARLAALDRRWRRSAVSIHLADHYIALFERRKP
jgi:SAM-dependent methyltransferase